MFSSKQLVALFAGAKPQCLSQITLRASICHKSELKPKNVKHWPYEEKSWNMFSTLLDPFTKNKFDENSKIIIVEGNVNSGKDNFARRLADELGMKYAPPIDLISYFYSDYGYDFRALNALLPERMRICDWKMFHENPTRHSVIHMLDIVFKLRLAQYIRAVQHVFNTGQGVVLNRSVYTDRVFIESMHNLGWLPMGYLRGDGIRFYDWRLRYNYIRERSCAYLLRPHLAIYLEAPVEKCMEKVKNSSDPMEANSKALIPELLQGIEEAYENVILPKMDIHMHILRYKVEEEDMTDHELFDVIDDIKQLDFTYDWHDTRFESWNEESCMLWHRAVRRYYTGPQVLQHLDLVHQSWYDIAGLGDSITEIDRIMRHTLYECHVTPVGWDSDHDTDIEQVGLLKTLMDKQSFKKDFDYHLKCDFY